MNLHLNFSVGATSTAPMARIKKIEPQVVADSSRCEGTVNLGVFFDGTNNNRDRDAPKLGDSNIVRLAQAYVDAQVDGYYRLYVPGVGTPFPEIGEEGESKLGNGFAIGCEQRVLYALCWVLDSLHQAGAASERLLSDFEMRTLCRNHSGTSGKSREEAIALHKLDVVGGLLMPDMIGEGCRVEILRTLAERVASRMRRAKPAITECFIDVFGFSRGAAQARVFCNWLNQIIEGEKLAGVPIHFRFLGIMDTVASAGFFSALGSSVFPMDGAHSGWADVDFLRIPKLVRNCVHMVAMHELRRNFPLDSVSVNGVIPQNCQEYAYPGVHSDVGGGYDPGELGLSVGASKKESDALKLAQIPLNHMLDCAAAAGSPMSRRRAKSPGSSYDCFAIDPRVQRVYEDFLKAATLTPRPLREWMQPYINWRWQVRHNYDKLSQVQRASEKDRLVLLKFNRLFLMHAAAMDRAKPKSVMEALRSLPGQIFKHQDVLELSKLDPESTQVYELARKAKQTPDALCRLFEGFVHDSMAGFDNYVIEGSGYWRYRKGYLGTNKGRIASNDATQDELSNMA